MGNKIEEENYRELWLKGDDNKKSLFSLPLRYLIDGSLGCGKLLL